MTDATSLTLPRPAPARVLACGAYLKNRAARLDGRQLQVSVLHGDLGEAAACRAFDASVDALRQRPGAAPLAVAHDLHPDFHSTRVALAVADELGVPAIGVQHHHAHIAAVVAEHGLDAPVIGLALDGVGLGSDGTAWGGELLWVGGGAQAHHWRRLAHLPALALPGGDVAAREPWRLAAAVLFALGRGDEIEPRCAPAVGVQAARTVHAMLKRGLNCPPTTSAGRWFDAAAGALGLSVRQSAEAEAAIALERCAADALRAHPGLGVASTGLDLWPVLATLLAVDSGDVDAVGRGAAQFHLALAAGLAQAAIEAARLHGLHDVALGGGCFMNRVLSGAVTDRLRAAGLSVHRPSALGCGDAGLALGQAWVAACQVDAGRSPNHTAGARAPALEGNP